jgi:hypothetical protein
LWTIAGAYNGTLVLVLFVVLASLTAIRMVGSIWIERRAARKFAPMRVFRWFVVMSVLIGASMGAIILATYPSLPPLRVAMSSVCIVGINMGLHYSACAARELRGNLTARSAGVGSGASFLLALPFGASAA